MRICIFIFCSLMLMHAAIAQSSLGIAAAPMKLLYNTGLGTTQTLRVTLHNPSINKLELQPGLSDWYRDSSGNIVNLPEGSLASSCAAWIRLSDPAGIVIEPGGKKDVMVSVLVPDSARHQFYNSMLYFTQINSGEKTTDANGIQIRLAVRVGIQILYTPAGLYKKNIDVLNFWNTTSLPDKGAGNATASDTNEHSRLLYLKLKNNGDVVADGSVAFECLNLQTGTNTKLKPTAFYTLPGAERVLVFTLPDGLVSGNYQATAMIDYGMNEELKIATLDFRID